MVDTAVDKVVVGMAVDTAEGKVERRAGGKGKDCMEASMDNIAGQWFGFHSVWVLVSLLHYFRSVQTPHRCRKYFEEGEVCHRDPIYTSQ